jgi:hypothetical protein
VIPFPMDEATPPLTKMYLATVTSPVLWFACVDGPVYLMSRTS